MSRVMVLGATGSLGREVVRQALAAGHEVSVFVRTPSKLPPQIVRHVSVHTGDLRHPLAADLVKGHDALINCAGYVADGETFVHLIERLVEAVEALPGAEQPVCWFLAGAALLDIGTSGRRGVDLPDQGQILAAPGALRAVAHTPGEEPAHDHHVLGRHSDVQDGDELRHTQWGNNNACARTTR